MSRASNSTVLKTNLFYSWNHDSLIKLYVSSTEKTTQTLNNLFIFFWFQNVLSKFNLRLLNLRVNASASNYELHPVIMGNLDSLAVTQLQNIHRYVLNNKIATSFNVIRGKPYKSLVKFFRFMWCGYRIYRNRKFLLIKNQKTFVLTNAGLFLRKKKRNKRFRFFLFGGRKGSLKNFKFFTFNFFKNRFKRRQLLLFIFKLVYRFRSLAKRLFVVLNLLTSFSLRSTKVLQSLQKYITLNFFNLNGVSSNPGAVLGLSTATILFKIIIYGRFWSKKKKQPRLKKKKMKKLSGRRGKASRAAKLQLNRFSARFFLFKKRRLKKIIRNYKKRVGFRVNALRFYHYVYFSYSNSFKQFSNSRLLALKTFSEISFRKLLGCEVRVVPYCFSYRYKNSDFTNTLGYQTGLFNNDHYFFSYGDPRKQEAFNSRKVFFPDTFEGKFQQAEFRTAWKKLKNRKRDLFLQLCAGGALPKLVSLDNHFYYNNSYRDFIYPFLKDSFFELNHNMRLFWFRVKSLFKKKIFKRVVYYKGRRIYNFTFYTYYVIAGLFLHDVRLFTTGLAKHLNRLRRHSPFFKTWVKFLLRLVSYFMRRYANSVKSIKIVFSGRINENDRARQRTYFIGSYAKLQDMANPDEYYFTAVHNKRGAYGLKVWFQY